MMAMNVRPKLDALSHGIGEILLQTHATAAQERLEIHFPAIEQAGTQ
jgi:hypothetical protein